MLIIAATTALAVVPASAQRWVQDLPPVAQGYADLRSPFKTLTDKTWPVGAWRDGENQFHSTKSYFTVDLKPLRGKRIHDVHAYTYETAVTDCAKPRSVELWQTEVAEQPTWARAPKELSRLEGTVSGECLGRLSWDISAALTRAVATGAEKATFALRMASHRQLDVGFGRRYAALSVQAGVNTPPSAATDPRVNGKPCDGREHLVGREPALHAQVTDSDPAPGFQIRYVVTDVAEPAKRHEGIATHSDGTYYLPTGFIEHGHTYEWTAQGEDGADKGVPSPPCRFTTDLAAPATAPVVTSADFPQTGAGFPGTITFDAGGDPDVVAFDYNGQATGRVAADQPGGKATITVVVPSSGDKVLDVRSVDRVGHVSNATRFRFQVRPTHVHVFELPVDHPMLGQTYAYTFTSFEPDVTEYVYSVNNGPEITVPAPCDRCSAAVDIRVTSSHSTSVSVRARTAAGHLTEAGHSYLSTHPSWPFVQGDRQEIRIFPPEALDIAEYLYRVNGATEELTVAADANGQAAVQIDFGDHPFPNVEVRGRTADGLLTQSIQHYVD
ncbi:hypothetical protein BBK82_15590 [Lentzea guizhouensis]|uniref:Fibronectin type-III domain-containing protein n=1 Tax=Lentzea guizhouensis TaxID=1586287 RepID=A0A1B2HHR2_9PSEU|nr:hypothetical protein BBK82_15590 [Lentzea guizhouensis]